MHQGASLGAPRLPWCPRLLHLRLNTHHLVIELCGLDNLSLFLESELTKSLFEKHFTISICSKSERAAWKGYNNSRAWRYFIQLVGFWVASKVLYTAAACSGVAPVQSWKVLHELNHVQRWLGEISLQYLFWMACHISLAQRKTNKKTEGYTRNGCASSVSLFNSNETLSIKDSLTSEDICKSLSLRRLILPCQKIA